MTLGAAMRGRASQPCREWRRAHQKCPGPPRALPPQAMFLMAWRLSKLYEEGKMTHEQVRPALATPLL